MHRCLQIDEILCNILDNISSVKCRRSLGWHRDLTELRTIVALAQTCRLFSEPALDRLWYYRDGLERLVQTLPQDAWKLERKGGPGKGEELRLVRDLEPEDFTRLDFYARRVHVLRDGHHSEIFGPNIRLHHLVIPTILSRRPSHPHLTPNLEHLEISLTDFSGLAWYPTAVITSRLRVIQLNINRNVFENTHVDKTAATWRNFGLLLSRAARLLEGVSIMVDFELDNTPLDIPDPEGLLSLLRRLKQAETLDIINVEMTAKLLRRLLTMDTLKTFNFSIFAPEAEEYVEDTEKLPGYICDLTTLSMRIDDLDSCYKLLGRIARPSLQALSIMRHSLDPEEEQGEGAHFWDMDLFLADLCQQPFAANLTQIGITHPKVFNVISGRTPEITRLTIEPLLQIRTLQLLQLSLYGTVNIGRETLKSMAAAWPDLKDLSLYERSVGTIPPRTLLDILSFASSCIHLESLRIRFDATQEDFEVKDLQGFSQCKSLRDIDVCTSPIRNPEIVGQLLTVAFPNLDHLMYGWDYDDEPDGGEEEEYYASSEVKYSQLWDRVGSDMHAL